MRIIFSILIILLSADRLAAQNLVPNPGFESVVTCNVTNINEGINSSVGWFTQNYSNNSPDIFNSCFSGPYLQVPTTAFGYSYPNGGSGMAGLGCTTSDNYREIISIDLGQTLIKDSAYCVSFYAKNCNKDNVDSWSQSLGLFLTPDTLNLNELTSINADVYSKERLDGDYWIKLEGYVIAEGDEQFLHIGYFGIKEIYHPSLPPNNAIYYFIDDVSLTQCNKDSLLNVVLDLPNVLTLNDNAINELYLIGKNNIKTLDVQVFNRWGNKVREYDGINEVWDGNDDQGNQLTSGVYFVKVVAETNFGDIVEKSQYVHLIRP